ncbi:MAG: hypothetical protein KJO07_03650 [Deltaproteobacteria bacterium]|nr:hypothetical protein [Deltaproteobacteria bacterium]
MWRFASIPLVLSLAVGCAARDNPYAFRGPVVAGIAADQVLPPLPRPASARDNPQTDLPGPAAHRRGSRQKTLATGLLVEPGDSLVSHLRSLVGARDNKMSATEFAVATLRGIGHEVDPDLAGTRAGGDLMSLAKARGAWAHIGTAELGDLLVFGGTEGKNDPASLVAVVIRQDPRGVIEFLYLQRGVIRRGFADPRRPSSKRDGRLRAVNTHVRVGKAGDARDSKYLAGELFTGRIDHKTLLAGN